MKIRLLIFSLLSIFVLNACEPTKTPICDPATQPAPHWGEKAGQCLKSCGALGGTAGFAESCDQHGMVDVGTAYDQAFCCKEKEPVCTCEGYNPANQECGKAGIDSCGQNVCLPVGTKNCIIDETPGDTPKGVPPPDVLQGIKDFRDEHPGMIHDCTGKPIANDFLNGVISKLQQKNKRWGYMLKPDGRIPRDILTYAYGPERENTHNMYVIDFVCAGCGNTPGQPDFNQPAPGASVCWQLLNLDTGFADNGVFRSQP